MKTGITITFLLVTTMLFSQEKVFKVFYYDGDIQYKHHKQKEWVDIISIDLTLKLNDSIALWGESGLYLIDNEGRQFYLAHPGKYEIMAVCDSIKNLVSQSLFTRYSQFIWDEFNKPHIDIEEYADRYLKDKGGVSRAANIPEIFSPFYGTYILNDQIGFKWEDSGAEDYTLSFWDSDYNGKRLFAVTISDTVFSISTKLSWMPENKVFYWAVTENRKPASNFIPVKVFGGEEKNKIHEAVNSIKKEIQVSKEVSLLMLAAFYEKNSLYQLANNSYQKAIRLNPENKVIKEYYNLFMARMGNF